MIPIPPNERLNVSPMDEMRHLEESNRRIAFAVANPDKLVPHEQVMAEFMAKIGAIMPMAQDRR